MVLQLVISGLIVYSIIHLHRKYGMKIFKTYAIEAFIGIGIATVIIAVIVIFMFLNNHPN